MRAVLCRGLGKERGAKTDGEGEVAAGNDGCRHCFDVRLLAQPQPKMIGHVQNLTSTELAVVWDERGSLSDSLKP